MELVKKYGAWIAVGVVGVAATVIAVVAKNRNDEEIQEGDVIVEVDENEEPHH